MRERGGREREGRERERGRERGERGRRERGERERVGEIARERKIERARESVGGREGDRWRGEIDRERVRQLIASNSLHLLENYLTNRRQ